MKNKLMSSEYNSEKREYKKWKKSVTKDDITKSVEVCEVENGYVINICTEGRMNGEWEYDEKKYISTKNPLEGEKEYKETIDPTKEIMDAIDALGL